MNLVEEKNMAETNTQTEQPRRLNLGSGSLHIEGYENLDIKYGHRIDVLDVDDGSIDEIRASHVLEHVSHRKTLDVLRHWFDKLKPGGSVKIAVPNFAYVVEKMQTVTDEPLEGYVMGGHSDSDDWHGALFTPQKLEHLLRAAGFDCIGTWKSELQDCASLPVSLNMTAQKPPAIDSLASICVVMSLPRLTFTDSVIGLLDTVKKLGCDFLAHTGAFWDQCLERAIEEAIAQKPWLTHILTVDYDSVFDAEDVKKLYRTIQRLKADALFPVQIKRQSPHAMLTLHDENGNIRTGITPEEAASDGIKTTTGHFGLTLLSVEKLKQLPKPWFIGIPDSTGKWGEERTEADGSKVVGRTDPDIYFWRQWAAAGNSLYQANHVRIGHAQLMVTYPDQQWRGFHVHTNEVQQHGKPLAAR